MSEPSENSSGGKIAAIIAMAGAALGVGFMVMAFLAVLIAPIGWVTVKLLDVPILQPVQDLLESDLLEYGCKAAAILPFIDSSDCWWTDLLDAASESGLEDALRVSFDCVNATEEARRKGECDPGALALAEDGTDSPLPKGKERYFELYFVAGERYDVPWQLLAAVHGARTNFGAQNCTRNGKQGGSMELSDAEWRDFAVDGGSAPPINKKSEDCWETDSAKISSAPDGKTDPRDVADAIFTQARVLAHYGATASSWNYTGSPPQSCRPDGERDGTIYPYSGGDSDLGSNSEVSIPREILQLANRYTYVRMNKTPPAMFNSYSDAHPVPGEGNPATDRRYLPRQVANQIITANAAALGLPFDFMDRKRPGGVTVRQGLLAAIQGESGFRPSIRQGKIGDVNDRYPNNARGMIQFVPGTFWSWRVPGYDNIYNPAHNLLAAMNAMKHATSMAATKPVIRTSYGIWLTGSGWGPGGRNPYQSDGGDSAEPVLQGPYKGTQIKWSQDPISNALRIVHKREGKYHSPCYVAHVNAWYKGFVEMQFGGGGSGMEGAVPADVVKRMEQGASAQVGLGYSNFGPRDKVAFSATGLNRANYQFDCSSFTAYVYWVAAKVWIGANTAQQWTYGGAPDTWAPFENGKVQRGIGKPPGGYQPGDLLFWRSGMPLGNAGTGHVIVVTNRKHAWGFGQGTKYDIGGYPASSEGWVRVKAVRKVVNSPLASMPGTVTEEVAS